MYIKKSKTKEQGPIANVTKTLDILSLQNINLDICKNEPIILKNKI